MVLYTDVKSDRSTVAILVRDIEIIVIVLGDGPDSAGSSAGVFDGIAVVVRPFIGEPIHIIGGYRDVQFNSFIGSNRVFRPIHMITVFVLCISIQIVFDNNLISYIITVAVFIIEMTIIITAFFCFKCIGRGIRTFDRIIVGIIPLAADF